MNDCDTVAKVRAKYWPIYYCTIGVKQELKIQSMSYHRHNYNDHYKYRTKMCTHISETCKWVSWQTYLIEIY